MRILGIVKDASKELPLDGARIGLFIRERELAVLYSDRDGTFEHKEAAQYIGESLICKLEKVGFKSQDITHKIKNEEVRLDIELVPIEAKEKNELTISVKDKRNNLLEGVKIILESEGVKIAAGSSDREGLFKINLYPYLKEKVIKYKAELEGFETVESGIRLGKSPSIEVILVRKAKDIFTFLPLKKSKINLFILLIVGVILSIINGLLVTFIAAIRFKGTDACIPGIIYFLFGIILTCFIAWMEWRKA